MWLRFYLYERHTIHPSTWREQRTTKLLANTDEMMNGKLREKPQHRCRHLDNHQKWGNVKKFLNIQSSYRGVTVYTVQQVCILWRFAPLVISKVYTSLPLTFFWRHNLNKKLLKTQPSRRIKSANNCMPFKSTSIWRTSGKLKNNNLRKWKNLKKPKILVLQINRTYVASHLPGFPIIQKWF